MKPLDPRLLRAAPSARRAVLSLGGLGLAQGVVTVATAFALTALAMAALGRGSGLLAAGGVVLALFAARGLLAWTIERVAARAGVAVQTELRGHLLAAWLTRDVDSRPERSRALTLAAQGSTAVEPYVARFLPALVAATVLPVLAIGALVVVDWPSALIVVVTLPLLPLFAALIGMTTRDDTRARWRALADLSGHYLDVVRGLPTLVNYGRAQRQVGTIREVSGAHRLATMRTLRLAFLSSAALELLATIAVALVAVTVGLRLLHGGLTLETGLLAILLAPEAYWPVRRVGTEFHAAADGAEALEGILGELEGAGATGAGEVVTEVRGELVGGELAPGIRAVAVRYSHPGATTPAVDGVDLEATTPGLTVVTGPSGAGKTTLLEVLAGIRQPTSGRVDAPVPVHLVTQRPFLAAGTLRDNLVLGATETPDDAALAEVLDRVDLADLVTRLPAGLATLVGDDGFGLSAGQRARVALARAALSAAPVVLLDEPTAHLDPASADVAHRVIADLARTRTVIAVTHRPELVAIADAHVHLRAPLPTPEEWTSPVPNSAELAGSAPGKDR
ncbi:thiol reductant ABC exporter subunit CydD [Janibacter sp. G56]|uniref:thiol reductant ABC exporter subunit CydD n=1 Tax=Janibacter sp. G56 TaxID=3418717 RepID=UPI003D0236F9